MAEVHSVLVHVTWEQAMQACGTTSIPRVHPDLWHKSMRCLTLVDNRARTTGLAAADGHSSREVSLTPDSTGPAGPEANGCAGRIAGRRSSDALTPSANGDADSPSARADPLRVLSVRPAACSAASTPCQGLLNVPAASFLTSSSLVVQACVVGSCVRG